MRNYVYFFLVSLSEVSGQANATGRLCVPVSGVGGPWLAGLLEILLRDGTL